MLSGPPSPILRVLLVEDDENDALLLSRHLRKAGFELENRQVFSLAELRGALQEAVWDVVIADYTLPGFTAHEALTTVQEIRPDLPFIVVSGRIDEETACSLMQAGAQDYLSKDRLQRLVPVIERERREAQIRRERRDALEAMRANEDRFRALASNVPGVLFQMEATGHGLYFDYLSEASLMLLGRTPESLISGRISLEELIVPDDRQEFRHALDQATRRGSTLNWEGRIQVPDSGTKWINIRCSPRTQNDDSRIFWEGVMWNITQSKQGEAELRDSRARLSELSEHLQRVKEDERERIARDIHDVLGGTLVGIKISARLLAGKLPPDDPLQGRVSDIEKMLDEAIATAGRVARELRPGILKEFGLAAAIESYAEDYAHRSGIPCTVLCADHDIEVDDDMALALFRTYQEALTNVSKHAQASSVEIRLIQEGDEVLLEVCDNGRGISEADLRKPRSFGLRSIQERLRSLQGTMSLQPRNEGGTCVIMRAPQRSRQADL